MNETSASGGSRSVDRAVDLLKVLARSPRPLRFAALQRETNLPKSGLHALLTSLVRSHLVERRAEGFQLGIAAFELGASVPFVASAREASREPLDELHAQVGETCHFGSLSVGDVLYLDRRDAIHSLRFVVHIGARKAAYATALGKAMLSLLDNQVVRDLYPEVLPPLTAATLGTLDRLLDELDVWRAKGYAVEHEESTVGVSCVGVAVRCGADIYGLSIAAPTQRVSAIQLDGMQPLLADASKKIKSELAVSSWLRTETA